MLAPLKPECSWLPLSWAWGWQLFKNSICYRPVEWVNSSARAPSVFQDRYFGGSSSQVQVLKVEVSDVGFKSFVPQGRDLSSLCVIVQRVGFMARLCFCFSYLFQCGFLHICLCVGITQPAFQFFSDEIVSSIVEDSVCSWEEMSSGSSHTAILNWNL